MVPLAPELQQSRQAPSLEKIVTFVCMEHHHPPLPLCSQDLSPWVLFSYAKQPLREALQTAVVRVTTGAGQMDQALPPHSRRSPGRKARKPQPEEPAARTPSIELPWWVLPGSPAPQHPHHRPPYCCPFVSQGFRRVPGPRSQCAHSHPPLQAAQPF